MGHEGAGLSNRRWLIADERGSIAAVTDGTGAALAINTYDEYGQPGAANLGRFQYTGQAWIPELGLYHYKARFYDPATGRFLQTDPIGLAGGLNLYAYAGADPVNATDPWGLYQFPGGIPTRPSNVDPEAYAPICGGRSGIPCEKWLPLQRSMYGGRSGASENSRRNATWAVMSPADRVNSMGLEAFASISDDVDRSALLIPVDTLACPDCGGGMPTVPLGRTGTKTFSQGLPALDRTGKVHGKLPRPEEFGRYSRDELQQLLQDLRQSVKERIRKNAELGGDRAHGQRQAAEQQLITQIERFLQKP